MFFLYKGAVILTCTIDNHNHTLFFEFWIVKIKYIHLCHLKIMFHLFEYLKY
jgi:hypothetical protein